MYTSDLLRDAKQDDSRRMLRLKSVVCGGVRVVAD